MIELLLQADTARSQSITKRVIEGRRYRELPDQTSGVSQYQAKSYALISLIRGCPQEIRIQRTDTDEGTHIKLSAGCGRAITTVLRAMYLTGLALFSSSMYLAFVIGKFADPGLILLLLLSGASIGYLSLRGFWSGGNEVAQIAKSIRTDCKDSGIEISTVFEQRMSPASWAGVFFVLWILSSGLMMVMVADRSFGSTELIVVISFLIMGAVLVLFASALDKPGADEYCLLSLISIGTESTVMFASASILPFLVLTLKAPQLTPPEAQSILALALISWIVIMIIMAIGICSTLRTSRRVFDLQGEFRKRTSDQSVVMMRSGGNHLRLIRYAFLLLILLICAIWAVSIVFSTLVLASSLLSITTSDPIWPTSTLQQTIALVFSLQPDHYLPILAPLVLALIPLALPCVLWWTSLRDLVRLRREIYSESPNIQHRDELESMLDTLSSLTKGKRTPTLIPATPGFGALYARSASMWSSRAEIVADVHTIISLCDPKEVTALLAHELAHFINGDCIRRTRLRFLCRLLCLGDSCIGLFENANRIEHSADRTAVEVFGACPKSLANGIGKLSRYHNTRKRISSGLSAISADVPRVKDRPKSILGLLKDWYSIYFEGATMSYWHPDTKDRIRVLLETYDER